MPNAILPAVKLCAAATAVFVAAFLKPESVAAVCLSDDQRALSGPGNVAGVFLLAKHFNTIIEGN
jgi:hypothetical protein